MDSIDWLTAWGSTLLIRSPFLLALLAGTILAFVAYLNRRRRPASCLGAIGFALLLGIGVLGTLTSFLPIYLVDMPASEIGRVYLAVGIFTALVDTAGIVLLILAVVMDRRSNGRMV